VRDEFGRWFNDEFGPGGPLEAAADEIWQAWRQSSLAAYSRDE
jgi:hypothetical protein